NCPDGYWENDNGDDPICSGCDFPRLTCESSGADSCLSCEFGRYIKDNRCLECPAFCPDSLCSLSEDETEIVCDMDDLNVKCPCDSTCYTCTPGSSTDCQSCGDGSFLNEEEAECQACDTGCLTCDGSPSDC
ncbi:MAG: hypothetical protein QF704_12865, partial [Anaerolineales bacterium]|nr:hypothetical protein [Anaerolineales bacterium]